MHTAPHNRASQPTGESLARQEFLRDTARLSLGFSSNLPQDNASWIAVFDASSGSEAPDGGPAYLAGRASTSSTASTGAIWVDYDPINGYVDIRRPGYISLVAFRVRITGDTIDIVRE